LLAIALPARAENGLPGVTGRDKLYGVASVGDRVWVVGFPGIVLQSTDKGDSFKAGGPGGTTAWLAVDFTDKDHGMVVGRGGKALVTRDGGKTWIPSDVGTKEPLFDVSCPDAKHCFAVGNFAAAVRTSDGGSTWESMHVVPEDEDPTLNGIAFADAETGFAVGEFGLIARTDDGGATWRRVDDEMNSDNNFGVAVLKDGTVLVVGSYGNIQIGRVENKRTDETRNTETDPSTRPDSEVSNEPPTMTFVTVKTGVKDHLFRVATGGDHLLVAGAAGTILYSNGPKGPWKRAIVPTFLWLADATIDSSGRGFAVGAQGVLVKTDDNGATWKTWRAK